MEPNSKYLYASYPNPLADAIGIFTIDPSTGVPTQTSVFSLNVICPFCLPPSSPGQLTLSPSGKFLYYASSTLGGGVSQGIGALAVDSAAGTLSFVTGSPFPADQAPFVVRVHPSGQFLYTENLDASGGNILLQSLSAFSVNATGALAPVPGSPFVPPVSATIGGLAIHPSGKFLYATSGMETNGLLAWNIDGTTGGLTVLTGSPFQVGVAIHSAGFDPSGKFLYATTGPPGGILGFNVDPNSGALTPIPGSPFSSGSFLAGPTVEPSGHFLFAGDEPNHTIVGFSIDSTTGALAALGSPAPLSARPVSLTIVKLP